MESWVMHNFTTGGKVFDKVHKKCMRISVASHLTQKHIVLSHFLICFKYGISMGLPCGSVVKNSPASAGDTDSIPGSRRSPGGDGNPFQYSCLENPMDGGAWWAIVHRVQLHRELNVTERLSRHTGKLYDETIASPWLLIRVSPLLYGASLVA